MVFLPCHKYGYWPTNTLTQDVLVFYNLNPYKLNLNTCHAIIEVNQDLALLIVEWVTALELSICKPFRAAPSSGHHKYLHSPGKLSCSSNRCELPRRPLELCRGEGFSISVQPQINFNPIAQLCSSLGLWL